MSSHKTSALPSLVPPTRPEEDILFQWRLRRKIEQAREWPQSLQHSSLRGPTFSWQTPNLSHASASGQAYKVGVIVHDIYSVFFVYYLFQIYIIILISSFFYSRVLSLLNSHKRLHIHTSLLPSQKPKKPTGHVHHPQVHLPSLPLLSLALQSLNPRLLPMFLPTCIYSVTSCPVPSSHLMLTRNKTFHKV